MAQKQNLFQSIRSALGLATSELSGIRADLAKLRARREFLVESPIRFDDFVSSVIGRVDAQADAFPAMLKRYVIGINATATRASKAGRLSEHVNLLTPIVGVGSGPANAPQHISVAEQALSWCFRDTIKSKLIEALTAAKIEWPQSENCGPPLSEREKELADLEAQIAQLETIERDMLAELRAALAVDATTAPEPERFIGGTPTAREGKAAL